VTLTFDLLTLKVVSESRMTWATSVPILDRGQTSEKASLNAPPIMGGGIISIGLIVVE